MKHSLIGLKQEIQTYVKEPLLLHSGIYEISFGSDKTYHAQHLRYIRLILIPVIAEMVMLTVFSFGNSDDIKTQ